MPFTPPLYVLFPRPEDPTSGLKPCEHQQRNAQAQHTYPGSRIHIPQCDEQGHFLPLQCHGSTGFCWCVDPDGHEVPGTRTPPGSTPPHCGPPGEPVVKETMDQVRPGLEKHNGSDCGVDYNPCPDHADSGLITVLFLPRDTRMTCAHLYAHSHYRDIETCTYMITVPHWTPAS